MDKKQFILDTLLPYKENPSLCAVNDKGKCVYLTKDGRKCAIGKHMKVGAWQKCVGDILDLTETYVLDDILKANAVKVGLANTDWYYMQQYHDKLATDKGVDNVNRALRNFEIHLGFKLPELYIN